MRNQLQKIAQFTFFTMASACTATVANAHMTIISGEASAGWYYDAVVGVPHGCSDPNSTQSNKLPNWDTYKVEVNVPKSFKKPRPYDSKFGKATITETNDFYVLTWIRNDKYPEYSTDTHSYKLQFKTKLPAGDFATHYIPATQYCHKNGVETKSAWVGTSHHGHGHGSKVKPAPKIIAYPKKRFAGWNKFTTSTEINNLSVFQNAQIVWSGKSAYSANPVTAEMIKNDKTVTELKSIPANTTIWVKY